MDGLSVSKSEWKLSAEALARFLASLDPDSDRAGEKYESLSRQLILQYYRDEKREKINCRLAMAERLVIPLNALRSRAQRNRNRLEECVNCCIQKNVGQKNEGG